MVQRMIREIAISVYLIFFKLIFTIFKFLPLGNKVTFTTTFGDNSKYVYEEMRRRNLPYNVIVLYKGGSRLYFEEYIEVKKVPLETLNVFHFFASIYHLATSKFVFVDNYFGFLAATDFKKGVECIQLWHASGAIKKFGLEDQTIKYRSEKSKARFIKVYKRFDKVVVGSDIMGDTFMRSFNLTHDHLLKTGIPRTDFYFDERQHQKSENNFLDKNPEIKNRKRILYAPTYRDYELDNFEIKLDIELMSKEMADNYVLLLRLHPAIKNSLNYNLEFPGFVYDFSSQSYNINELLLLSDYLITDYSSIPYEYSLLNKPIIFFSYDLEEYKQKKGLIEDYENNVPGPVVKKTQDVVKIIKDEQFDLEELKRYSNKWNKYSNGNSSENLVKYMIKKEFLYEK